MNLGVCAEKDVWVLQKMRLPSLSAYQPTRENASDDTKDCRVPLNLNRNISKFEEKCILVLAYSFWLFEQKFGFFNFWAVILAFLALK